MSEQTPDEILRLAQERIAQRRHAEQAPRERVPRNDRPWQIALLSFVGVLLLALVFSPGAPLEWKMYAVVHGVCAQQNNIFLGDLQFPLCARNSGIYMSFLMTLGFMYFTGRGLAGRLPALPISLLLLLFTLIMAVDGFNSLLVDIGGPSLYAPDNRLRTLSGMGMGMGIAVLVHLMLNLSLRANVDRSVRAIGGWRDFALIIGINLFVLVAIYGNLSFMFWPLAFTAFFGIIGVLYLVALMVTGLIMGYEGKITSLRELARPATIALIPTLFLTIGLSIMRFSLEGQGIIF